MDRALQILDYLYDTGAPASGYAISKAIGVPLSTSYVVIDELVSRDLLVRRDSAKAGNPAESRPHAKAGAAE